MSEDTPDAVSKESSRGLRLATLAGVHGLVWLLFLGLFAAADSWSTLTGLGLATVLCVISGVLAGLVTTTLIHEWFHYLGARVSGANYAIPTRRGLFVFDWDFGKNSLGQFYLMSIAGSVGGAVAIVLLWSTVPADTWGRAALRGGAIAGFVFAAFIEWPVLRRTRASGEPLAELSKIDQGVLSRSFMVASIAGVAMTAFFNG